jgi:hypothetical protein
MWTKFLLVSGLAVVGFLVAVFLHNAIYAVFHVEEPVFFLLAVVVAPLAFGAGIVGAIVTAVVAALRAR